MISGLSLEDITKSYLFNCKKEIKSKKLVLTKDLLQHYKFILGRKQRSPIPQPEKSSRLSFSKYILQSDDRRATESFQLQHFVKRPKSNSAKPVSLSCNNESLRKQGLSIEQRTSNLSIEHNPNHSETRQKIQPKSKSKSNKSFSSAKPIKSDGYLATLQMNPETIKLASQAKPIKRAFPSDITGFKQSRKTDYIPMFDEFMAQTVGNWNPSIKNLEPKAIKKPKEAESLFSKKRPIPCESIKHRKSICTISKEINTLAISDSHSNRKVSIKSNQPEAKKENLDVSFESTESFKCLKKTIDNFYAKACHPRSNYAAL